MGILGKRKAHNGEEQRPEDTVRARAAHAVQHHPWLSLTGIITIVTAVPSIIAVGGWAAGLVAKPSDLEKLHTTIMAETATALVTADKKTENLRKEFDVLKEEFGLYRKDSTRNAAWAYVQGVRNEARALASRVNDCQLLEDNRRKQHSELSSLERTTCDGYRDDLKDAQRRFIKAQDDAAAASK